MQKIDNYLPWVSNGNDLLTFTLLCWGIEEESFSVCFDGDGWSGIGVVGYIVSLGMCFFNICNHKANVRICRCVCDTKFHFLDIPCTPVAIGGNCLLWFMSSFDISLSDVEPNKSCVALSKSRAVME